MSDHDMIRRGDALMVARDLALGHIQIDDVSDALHRLPAVDVAGVCEKAVQAEREEIANLLEIIFAANDGIELRLGGTSETITLIEIVATIRARKGGAAQPAPINWRNDPTVIVEDDEPQIGRDYA